ncbi:MFS transporter [Kitasatospora sp. NPDC058201]|uniref:MFS transporter n=1 Tax=unclassified Kitasatospora TaxID=2633591 RepID=UPI00365C7DB7
MAEHSLTPTAAPRPPFPPSSSSLPSAPVARPPGGWPAVLAVAAATFAVVTSEMLPVALLTPIGGAMDVTEGTAGLTLTVTGLVAAVSAPPLTSALGRWDRRRALCVLLVLLGAANLLAAWAPVFAVMVAARVLVGLAMGGVWSLAAGVAVRLVPRASAGPATATAFSGVALASVLGVPAGAFLGGSAGWRAAFAVLGGLALLVAAAVALLVPPLPAERALGLGGVLRLAAVPGVRTGLIVVALLVTGHFAAYTYVSPVLEEVSGASAGQVGVLLLVYGAGGIVGNFVAGAVVGRGVRASAAGIGAALAVSVLALPVVGRGVPGAVVLVALWGLAYGGVSVTTQTWLTRAAPDATEGASALFVAVFNAAIALGALAGGRIVDGLGPAAVMWLGGVLVAAVPLAAALLPGPSTVPGPPAPPRG